MSGEGCRVQRWMPAERFAPYVARPVMLPTPQVYIFQNCKDYLQITLCVYLYSRYHAYF